MSASQWMRRGGVVLLSWRCAGLSLTTKAGLASKAAFEAHDAALLKAGSDAGAALGSREAHNIKQASVFDGAAQYFASPEAMPEQVELALKAIAFEVAEVAATDLVRVLDVGTGTGCLARLYGPAQRKAGFKGASVVGVDLSVEMLVEAEMLQDAEPPDSVEYWQGDVIDYCTEAPQATGFQAFDSVVFNACFGNLFSPAEALQAVERIVKPGGSIFVTHPIGSAFVDDLRDRDASVVPHALPKSIDQMRKLVEARASFLVPTSLVERTPLEAAPEDAGAAGVYQVPYVATWTRRAFAPLPSALALRGAVAKGYGRGSSKLGIPTANLPEDLFGAALADVSPGVYCGWARVGGDEVSRAVVNVGYSPTFQGEENKVKIVEAHLLDHASKRPFYDETLTLLLVAFQRPEMKFDGLPALIAAINNDVDVAAAALRTAELATFETHPIFASPGDEEEEDASFHRWLTVA
ncbi:hypothetical protein M885DRAFT_560626 [Pelagophyceae sp. CCMP2097]|nr:hypothetical protein M885DRAFT_560626 [Pelagophyceae sp. CCMP2097]